MAEAIAENSTFVRFLDEFFFMLRFWLEALPQIGPPFEIVVFLPEHDRYQQTGIAAKRNAVVVGGTELSAIVQHWSRIELPIDVSNITIREHIRLAFLYQNMEFNGRV
jgi:hypothetical protein